MVVLVTGASTGIGRATALRSPQRGHTVYAGRARRRSRSPSRPVQLDVTNAGRRGRAARPPARRARQQRGDRGHRPARVHAARRAARASSRSTRSAQLAVTQACLPALRAARRAGSSTCPRSPAAACCRCSAPTPRRSSRSRRSATRCGASCADEVDVSVVAAGRDRYADLGALARRRRRALGGDAAGRPRPLRPSSSRRCAPRPSSAATEGLPPEARGRGDRRSAHARRARAPATSSAARRRFRRRSPACCRAGRWTPCSPALRRS